MPIFGDGAKPRKTTEAVATELRQRLERQLGRERTEAIWRDPTNVQEVLQGDQEAASVAGIILQALKDLPEEEAPGRARTRSGFRRGLRLALVAAVAVWALSVLNKARHGSDEEGQEPL